MAERANVVVILFLSLALTCYGQNCNMDTIDVLGAKLSSFSDIGRKFAETRTQMTEYCKETKEDIQTLTDFTNKCLNGTTKQFTSVMIFSIKNILKSFCSKKNKKRTDELLQMAKCSNSNRKQINQCLDPFIEKIQGANYAKQDKRLPHVCCEYYKTLSCMDTVLKPKCPKYADLITDFLRNIFNSVVDVVCGDYIESSDKCSKLPAPPKKPSKEKRNKSFLVPLINLWKGLDDH